MSNESIKQEEKDPALHFLESCRRRRSRSDLEDEEELPTELNTINSSGGFLVVSPDKLSVKYTGLNLHGHDVGVVQANRPAPSKRLLYYFEIFVKNDGAKGQISIGFTSQSFKMRRQPGWEENSCGYHGDDGRLYLGDGKGRPFGPTYASGDTVGGGINYPYGKIFFTKNGAIVGTKIRGGIGPLFPTIAVHSQNEEVNVNFGQKPFAFDIKEFEAQERMKQQMKIETEIQSFPPNISYELVRSYLLHYGYEDTINSLDMDIRTTVPPISTAQEKDFNEQDILYALNQRKTLRQLIKNGEIDSALGTLRDWYPQIVQDDKSATCFLLHCQKFIELVRVGMLEDAVKFASLELEKFFGMTGFEDLVQECIALLAYEPPQAQESSVGYLLEESQREVVADTVNAMILSSNPNVKDSHGCLYSRLERLLRQLVTSWNAIRLYVDKDRGEIFRLHRVLEQL